MITSVASVDIRAILSSGPLATSASLGTGYIEAAFGGAYFRYSEGTLYESLPARH